MKDKCYSQRSRKGTTSKSYRCEAREGSLEDLVAYYELTVTRDNPIHSLKRDRAQ